jgi:hypothetical protein
MTTDQRPGQQRAIQGERELLRLSPLYDRNAQGLDSAAALVTPEGVKAAAAEKDLQPRKDPAPSPSNDIDYLFAHGFSYEPFRSMYEESEVILREGNSRRFTPARRNCSVSIGSYPSRQLCDGSEK